MRLASQGGKDQRIIGIRLCGQSLCAYPGPGAGKPLSPTVAITYG